MILSRRGFLGSLFATVAVSAVAPKLLIPPKELLLPDALELPDDVFEDIVKHAAWKIEYNVYDDTLEITKIFDHQLYANSGLVPVEDERNEWLEKNYGHYFEAGFKPVGNGPIVAKSILVPRSSMMSGGSLIPTRRMYGGRQYKGIADLGLARAIDQQLRGVKHGESIIRPLGDRSWSRDVAVRGSGLQAHDAGPWKDDQTTTEDILRGTGWGGWR